MMTDMADCVKHARDEEWKHRMYYEDILVSCNCKYDIYNVGGSACDDEWTIGGYPNPIRMEYKSDSQMWKTGRFCLELITSMPYGRLGNIEMSKSLRPSDKEIVARILNTALDGHDASVNLSAHLLRTNLDVLWSIRDTVKKEWYLFDGEYLSDMVRSLYRDYPWCVTASRGRNGGLWNTVSVLIGKEILNKTINFAKLVSGLSKKSA